MYSGQIKCLIPFLQCILYQLLFILNMIKYRYLCRMFERNCTFDDVFSLFEVDQVNAKYVSRATQARFFVNYVTRTSQLDKIACTDKVWTMAELNVSNAVHCENKSNIHRQNPQWWCFSCPLPPLCFAQKYIVYGQGPIA